jgi:hypothetical protein
MTTTNDHDQPIDPRLQELLDLLRTTPPRDPAAQARGEARFMAEVEAMAQSDSRRALPVTLGWGKNSLNQKERFAMTTLKRRTTLTVFTALFVALLFLFGGFGMTAYAAQSALPGDALYPLKTNLEQVRLSATNNNSQIALLYMRFAENRLEEISSLIDAGRYDDIAEAASEFGEYVQKALGAVQVLAASDPEQAAELSAQISASLMRFTQSLTELMASVPESLQPEMRQALEASQSATGSGLENENANLNENEAEGNENEDNVNDDGNANTNGNENDDNANGNENESNANGNENDANDNDDNENEDCLDANNDGLDDQDGSLCSDNDNGEDNGNDNGNGNENDDDHGGINGNDDDDNGNDDDDNGNDDDDNGNDGGGGNDNGGGDDNDNGGGNDNDDGGNGNENDD